MAAPIEYERAGTYLILFFFSVLAAIIGFLKGFKCDGWYCSYIFLGLGLIFLIIALKKIFS